MEDRFTAAAWAAKEGGGQFPAGLHRRRSCSALALQLLTAYQGALLLPPSLLPAAESSDEGNSDTIDCQVQLPGRLYSLNFNTNNMPHATSAVFGIDCGSTIAGAST